MLQASQTWSQEKLIILSVLQELPAWCKFLRSSTDFGVLLAASSSQSWKKREKPREKLGISCPSAWSGNLIYENRMGNKKLCPSLMWTNMIKKIAHHSAHPFGSSLMKHSHTSSSDGALLNARASHPAATTALICPGFPRVELTTLCTTGTGGTAGFSPHPPRRLGQPPEGFWDAARVGGKAHT